MVQLVQLQTTKDYETFMPSFIGYISLSFPSGLVIYWHFQRIPIDATAFHLQKLGSQDRRSIMEFIDVSAKTIEDAIAKGVAQFYRRPRIGRNKVLEQPSSGF